MPALPHRPLAATLLAGLALPAGAAPAQAAPAAAFSIAAERVGTTKTVLTGQRFRVRGVVQPYVAGQRATVRIYHGQRKLYVRSVALQPSSTGKSGFFVVGFATRTTGRLRLQASHLATPELATIVAKPVHVTVLPARATPGGHGRAVRELQRRLRAMHYVPGSPGRYDGRTGRAVVAFQKVAGLPRTGVADTRTFRALVSGRGSFPVRFRRHGRHVEADLSRQVLALIGSGGRVERIYPISSGKPSTPTVLGSFRVYSKSPGFNAKGMYFSSYFIRGYAIHGYMSVPVYNASHGCLRVPIPDAIAIYSWARLGTPVDVYA